MLNSLGPSIVLQILNFHSVTNCFRQTGFLPHNRKVLDDQMHCGPALRSNSQCSVRGRDVDWSRKAQRFSDSVNKNREIKSSIRSAKASAQISQNFKPLGTTPALMHRRVVHNFPTLFVMYKPCGCKEGR